MIHVCFSICCYSLTLITLQAPAESARGVFRNDEQETVSLEVQFGDGKKKRIEKIPFKADMTILDVMKYAKKNKKIDYKFRGKNETAFLLSIDGVKNKGARGDNWIFRVNKKLGRKSFGITKLNADDVVTWTFGKYKP